MHKLYRIICHFLIACSSLQAVIIETAHFKEIANHITPDTLVLLDIDDTLLIPTQTLGTDVWFQYRWDLHKTKGLDTHSALEKALAEWESVRHMTSIKIVEEGTEKIIEELQNTRTPVMGLTTQGLALATRTIEHIKMLGIDLTKTAPCQEDHYFMNTHGVLYRQGILFTSGTAKGPALLKLLDILGLHPKHIVFINDKKSHLRDVEGAVEARDMRFTGLRYSYSDERVAHFQKEIADIQWKYSTFDRLLSDEEAAQTVSKG